MDQLSKKIYFFLDQCDYQSARNIVNYELKNLTHLLGNEKIIAESLLYGFLIDIGCESQTESDLDLSVSFLKQHQELLSSGIQKSSYYYNLANALHGQAKTFYYKNRGIHSHETQKRNFQEPIKYYWLALNNLCSHEDKLQLKISINLSNALITVGRFVEAIQFLDSVLKIDPKFPQALISRADHLNLMSSVTNCANTIALFIQIYNNYDSGIKSHILPPSVLQKATRQKNIALEMITKEGYDVNNISKEIFDTQNEFLTHSAFRKYCILNYLTLNEHGIYCGCVANTKDDLQIGVGHGAFQTEVLPKLELLLNRLKSEFAFARWSYYTSLDDTNTLEFDAQFSDLLENEIITPHIELQRTSYRICYGILDKIALGICKLYNLPAKRIHFETFWDEPKLKLTLNNIKNLHLNALYSIACDLNTSSGELKHFKNWRNKLEHNLLIIKNTLSYDEDYLKVFDDKDFVIIVDANVFKEKTLHLLQLTRAAILSFVYCVRLQTIEHPAADNKSKGFAINLK